MAWHYINNGKILGPFSDDEFAEIRLKLEPTTRIWADGWKDWQKLEQAEGLPKAKEAEPSGPPPIPDDVAAAPFMLRFFAWLLDALIIGYLASKLGLRDSGFWSNSSNGANFSYYYNSYTDNLSTFWSWALALELAHETLASHYLGGTVGKLITGLRVSHQGRRITLLRSLARAAAKQLSQKLFYLGFVMAAFDKTGLALHDYICKTRITRK